MGINARYPDWATSLSLVNFHLELTPFSHQELIPLGA